MPDGTAGQAPVKVEVSEKKRRAFWLQQMHTWHWISSAFCLIGMLLFSITGITLNHAGQIEGSPRTVNATADLPKPLLKQLQSASREAEPPSALSSEPAAWLEERFDVVLADRDLEWSEEELYIGLPRPGGDAWLSIDLSSGAVEYERTERGWIAYFNDLHKGRDTGPVWGVFIDVFAIASLIFCITGLLLLQLHARRRPATWPVVGLGFGVMLVIMVVFIH